MRGILTVTHQVGSMRRGQRTSRPDNKEDRHTCYLRGGNVFSLIYLLAE